MALKPESLIFDRGHEDFDKEEFIKILQPYMQDLSRVGRTNFLCAFTFGDKSKPLATGYRTSDTINATINEAATRSDKSGGKWAVFRFSEQVQ